MLIVNKSHPIILVLSLIWFKHNNHLNMAFGDKNLSEALSTIVNKVFLKRDPEIIIFSSFDKNSKKSHFEANDLINGVLHHISNGSYRIVYHQQKKYLNYRHNEIVLLDNVQTFGLFYRELKYLGNEDYGRTILYISSLTTLDYEAIYAIFKELYLMEMLRVALIIKLADDDIIMLTYFPFTHTSCRDYKPVIINRFLADQHRWEKDVYFPNKLDDFHGCPVYCCTWDNMPYFGVKRNKNNHSLVNYVGLEAEILKFAALALNFSMKVRWIKPIKEKLDNRENVFSKIFSHHCDLAVGAFNYRNDLDYAGKSTFSQIKPHSFNYIYIVTNVNHFPPTYNRLAYPFSNAVWYALGLTFALSFLLIWACERYRKMSVYRNFIFGSKNKIPGFNLCALAIGDHITTVSTPKRNFARFLLICWILLTFILRVAYQSGMYQILRDNKQWKLPQTIKDVYEQKYLISTTPENHKYLEILPPTKNVRIFNTTILEALMEMTKVQEPLALIVPYNYFGYFMKKNGSQWQKLHLVRQRLLSQRLTIYLRHHSYLLRVLKVRISNTQCYGFISTWKHRNSLSHTNALKYAKKLKKRRITAAGKHLLTMTELGALFMILVCLHVLSFAVFIIEITWNYYRNNRN